MVWGVLKFVGKSAVGLAMTAATVATIYVGGQAVLRDAGSLNDKLTEIMANQAVEREVIINATEAIPSQALAAIYELLPIMNDKIAKLLDLNDILLEIKSLRSREKDFANSEDYNFQLHRLWEEVKVKGITRFLTTIYAFSALLCILQVNLTISSRIVVSCRSRYVSLAASADESDEYGARFDSISNMRREECLRTLLDTFFERGIPALVRYIRETVIVLMSTPMYQVIRKDGTLNMLGREDFLELMNIVMNKLEENPSVTPALLQSVISVKEDEVQAFDSVLLAPSKCLSLLLPTTSIPKNSIGMESLASSFRHSDATNSFDIVPWSTQLLLNLTVDLMRSPHAQAAFRSVALCAFQAISQRDISVVYPTNSPIAIASAAVAMPKVIVSFLNVNAKPETSSTNDDSGSQKSNLSIQEAARAEPLQSLCRHIMWDAKFM